MQSGMFNLEGKKIAVFGSSGLLGQALIRTLAEEGAIVLAADLFMEKTEALEAQLNEELGRQAVVSAKVDITDKQSINEAVNAFHAAHGKIDSMINSAYPRNKTYGSRFEKVSYESFCENTNLHMGGYFLTAQQFAEYFKEHGGGHILLFSSIYGITAPDFSIYDGTEMTMPVEYAAIKAGLNNLVRYVTSYYGPHGVRANCISPGGVFDSQDERFVENYCRKTPMGRMADSMDIIGPTLFMLSDAARYIAGHDLVVDGGITTHL